MPDEQIRMISFGRESEDPVNNQEIATLIDFIDDYMRQITACPSASDRNWMDPDLKIIRHNSTRLAEMVDNFSADPQMYMPNTDRTEMNIASPPELMQPENQGALIITRLLARFRMQLRNGSSSKMVSGFHPKEHEYVIEPSLAKLDLYIASEEQRFASGDSDYFPDVNDQEPSETTPGDPDNQV